MDEVVYVGIGNSDDKLTQQQWAWYARDTRLLCQRAGEMVGVWFSEPSEPYQNACFCVKVKPAIRPWFRQSLIETASMYDQQEISWAEAETVMLRPIDHEVEHEWDIHSVEK